MTCHAPKGYQKQALAREVWTTCLTKPKSIAALKLGAGRVCSVVAGSAAAAAAAIHLRPWQRNAGIKSPSFLLIADLVAIWGGFNSKLSGQGELQCSEVCSCLRQRLIRERCKRRRAKAGPELLQVRQAIKLNLLVDATAECPLEIRCVLWNCRLFFKPSRPATDELSPHSAQPSMALLGTPSICPSALRMRLQSCLKLHYNICKVTKALQDGLDLGAAFDEGSKTGAGLPHLGGTLQSHACLLHPCWPSGGQSAIGQLQVIVFKNTCSTWSGELQGQGSFSEAG